MLYQRILKIQRITEGIVEGIETGNRTMISELELLEPKIRELVKENSRNIENQVRKLVDSLVEDI